MLKIINILVVLLVVANIAVMCLDRLNISDREIEILDYIDIVFFGCFVLEMAAKMYIQGAANYFCKSVHNVFDVVVNVFGLVAVILAQTSYWLNYEVRGVIVILRCFRAFKLVDKWQTLQETLTFIWITLSDIFHFMILLALFVFIYAIIGMELFGKRVKFNSADKLDLENGESPQFNFDTLSQALILSYTMVIGENWSSYLYSYSRRNYAIGVIYFYTGIYVMNVFLVNVFLAIILENFYTDETKKEWEEQERKDKLYEEKMKKIKNYKDSYSDRERTLLTALKVFKSVVTLNTVSYTHLTLPTNREV
eukprot:TRINITY_DN4155_c0_g4_i1.p1 TRINITY_DN4155_c0_g4~~TRINITY_DN4155_c0_g4_i1.p1  ORF type:complete len:309 (+),score=102.47 TRINITY_DN4155_c0_g4_i1:194-1120(+)